MPFLLKDIWARPAGSCRASPTSLCVVLQGALVQCRRALKPDGLLLAVMFGGDTLHELRVAVTAAEEAVEGGISQRVSPLAQVGHRHTRLLCLDKGQPEGCHACQACEQQLAGLPQLGRCNACTFKHVGRQVLSPVCCLAVGIKAVSDGATQSSHSRKQALTLCGLQVADAGSLLTAAGFNIPSVDLGDWQVHYKDFQQLTGHLRWGAMYF